MSKESWVPDYVPQFTKKDLSFLISNAATRRDIMRFAVENDINVVELVRKLIAFGLIVANSEESDSGYTLIERENQNFTESKVSLPLEGKGRLRLYRFGPLTASSGPGRFSASIGGGMSVSVLRLLGDDFMAIANRYHTTVEYVMEGMFQTGINAMKSSYDGTKTYIVREKNGEDREWVFFGSDPKD